MNVPLIIIQARMNSKRLPFKALLPILDRPLLSYTFERLLSIRTPCKLLLATTEAPSDDPLESLAKSFGLEVYRGSETNVLERFYCAAKPFEPEVIVRITGDCPLVQPSLLKQMLSFFQSQSYDYISNVLKRSYPKGMDLELFTFKALERAYKKSSTLYQKEHVTPYFYQNPNEFSLFNFEYSEDFSYLNVSVDTKEDFEFVKKIITYFYPKNPLFELQESLQQMLIFQSEINRMRENNHGNFSKTSPS